MRLALNLDFEKNVREAGAHGITAGRRRLHRVLRKREKYIVSEEGELPEKKRLRGQFTSFGDVVLI